MDGWMDIYMCVCEVPVLIASGVMSHIGLVKLMKLIASSSSGLPGHQIHWAVHVKGQLLHLQPKVGGNILPSSDQHHWAVQ